MMKNSFDPVWEDIYGKGEQLNRYPYDFVVSYVYHYAPRDKPRREVRILEVGCGAGNNLWFAAREGFQVAGVDASPSAIAYAQKRFVDEGLHGDLRIGEFAPLPFESNTFDLAIDRVSITNVNLTAAWQAVAEVRRVLIPGGKFLFNVYSERDSSYASGRTRADGLTEDITVGLTGMGGIRFYNRRELTDTFANGWKVLSIQHLESIETIQPQFLAHAEWRTVAEKVS